MFGSLVDLFYLYSTIKNKNIMTNLRTATIEDFKVGTTLITTEGYKFTLREKYDEGIWESNEKVHFENEARFYRVEN